MSFGFQRIIAAWFVLQIVLPFTAPMQVCALGDLWGADGAPQCIVFSRILIQADDD